MISILKSITKNFFGENFYNLIKNNILSFLEYSNFKKRSYNYKEDLNYNENILLKIFKNFNRARINEILLKNKLLYNDDKISWHYHLFACFDDKSKNVLEIGTLTGEFTKYLADILPNSKIYSIDLSQDDENFIKTYDRNSNEKLEKFIKIRNENLNSDNIIFKELDSFDLIREFKNVKFDIIWIDGDHYNPQVTIDIFSAYNLINDNGFIICDDIVKNNYKTEYVNNNSYKTLKFFEKKKKLSNNFILKRVTKDNYKIKKYISISKKI